MILRQPGKVGFRDRHQCTSKGYERKHGAATRSPRHSPHAIQRRTARVAARDQARMARVGALATAANTCGGRATAASRASGSGFYPFTSLTGSIASNLHSGSLRVGDNTPRGKRDRSKLIRLKSRPGTRESQPALPTGRIRPMKSCAGSQPSEAPAPTLRQPTSIRLSAGIYCTELGNPKWKSRLPLLYPLEKRYSAQIGQKT